MTPDWFATGMVYWCSTLLVPYLVEWTSSYNYQVVCRINQQSPINKPGNRFRHVACWSQSAKFWACRRKRIGEQVSLNPLQFCICVFVGVHLFQFHVTSCLITIFGEPSQSDLHSAEPWQKRSGWRSWWNVLEDNSKHTFKWRWREHHYKQRAARGCMRYDQRSSGLRQCPCPCEESLLVSVCLKDIPNIPMIQTFRACCLKFNWFHFGRQKWMGAGKSLAYVSKSNAQMCTLWVYHQPDNVDIPSGKLSHNYGKSQFLWDNQLWMAIFNSYRGRSTTNQIILNLH